MNVSPVYKDGLLCAAELLRCLPGIVPDPNIYVGGDARLCLDWNDGETRLVLFFMGQAWIDVAHITEDGVETFSQKTEGDVPPGILSVLISMFGIEAQCP